jgi:hypothetical protein
MKSIYVIYNNYGDNDETLLDYLGYFEHKDDCVDACNALNMGHDRTYGTSYAVVEIGKAEVEPRQLELF